MTRSLFEVPQASPVATAADWLAALVTGTMAQTIAVMAIAVLGIMTMSGRLPVRAGLRVVLGCFVLFGAPVIAGGLMGVVERDNLPTEVVEGEEAARPPLPQSTFDPYAGASIRVD
ncbi:MAG: hypothetical protein DI591_12235 [Citromicrobium sp.]|nr:MAG: hypothetical protein DI591_12235 [Citromicrobium sp.]